MKNEAEHERMIGARMRLVRDCVFFGVIALGMKLVEDCDLETLAATDGETIFYNPDRTVNLSNDELVGLIGHEGGHPILLHIFRRMQRGHKKWNRACDYALNPLLVESGLTIPAGGCYSAKYFGMSAEEIYMKLPDDDSQQPYDEVRDGSGPGTEEQKIGDMKSKVQQAAALARKAGQMTGGLEKLVEAVCEPRADWQAILWNFMTARAETDYSWARPHQRMLQQYGVMSPTMDGQRLGRLVITNDASGSCYREQEQFASELSDILEQFEVDITVLHFDTRLKSVEEYTSSDLPIVMHPSGFGGTDPTTTFQYIEENLNPDVIIMLTDGFMSFKRVTPPTCPTLIALSSRKGLEYCPDWATTIGIWE